MTELDPNQENIAPEEPTLDELVIKVCAADSSAKPYQGNSNCPSVEVTADNLLALMTKLNSDPEFLFDMLSSHTVVDRIEKNIFELVYYIYSLTYQKRLMVSVYIPRDKPVVPTLSSLWRIAEFQEREAYDLFGIEYDNHKDLRRVFLEDDWKGFPLRKDYKDDFMLTWKLDEQ